MQLNGHRRRHCHQPVFISSVSEEALHTSAAHQAHSLILKKALNFIFISEYVLCFLQLLPHCCFSVLLTFVPSHHFLAVSCRNSTPLTSPNHSPSLVHSNAAFVSWNFSPISSRSATPSPSKTAAGRAGRDRFAGESYTVLGKDVAANPNQAYSSP